MTDIFQFSSIYAVTAEITSLVNDSSLQEECINYVSLPDHHEAVEANVEASTGSANGQSSRRPKHPAFTTVFELYASLRQGLTLKHWYMDNKDLLEGIDVRRFISFGVIKGILYRVHKYPVPNDPGQLDRKLPMAKYLDGSHHFDDICTDLQIPEKEAATRLAQGYGDIQIVHR